MSSNNAKQKAGRKYTVDANGISSLKKDFIVDLGSTMGKNSETLSFEGVPVIGSSHPNYPGLIVDNYDVSEGSGSDKNVLTISVNYSLKTFEVVANDGSEVSCQVDEWGWDDGTEEVEMIMDVDGNQVLNSAGEPYDSVPKYSIPSPVFTKSMKFKTLQQGWYSANCKVNSSQITVGGIVCPVGTLLCTVSMKRLFNDPQWNYQYVVRLRKKKQLVKICGSSSQTDIGWDISIADAGMNELDDEGKRHLIRRIDKETGRMCTVTSSALLNGEGKQLPDNGDPYNFRFKAYERVSFPDWFYSEPTLPD